MSFRTTISYVLFPFTMWYAIGVRVRNMLYALGLKKQEAPHITTIGIGNLSTGGTGKTPHVEYLLRLLGESHHAAMLSRGYKRRSHGFCLDDGSHDATQLGDEAAMIAAKFPDVAVAVCENRVEGVHRLMSLPLAGGEETESEHATQLRPDLVVMDDVFQHRRIKPSINILLTDYSHPYYRDRILPYGNLREFRSARHRANIVVVTKTPERMNPIDRHNIIQDLRLQNYHKVFFSYLRYGALQTLDGREAEIDLRHMDNILVLTGIAQPQPLLQHIRQVCKAQPMAFADHHAYTQRDIGRIAAALEALPGTRKAIVTTEKDAIRLRGLAESLPIYVQPVEVAFHDNDEGGFDHAIKNMVQENISFISKLEKYI